MDPIAEAVQALVQGDIDRMQEIIGNMNKAERQFAWDILAEVSFTIDEANDGRLT